MSPDAVIEYWLGTPALDEPGLNAKIRRWFSGGKAVDDEIRARFGDLVPQAIAGELDRWAETPRTRRALIIVLDQFTRNLGLNTPAAFAGDAKARALALEALDRNDHIGLNFEELLFLSIPLEHSESLPLHDRYLAVLEKFVRHAPRDWVPIYDRVLSHPRGYREQIARFGRFPHRNSILGRVSTPDEQAFLAASSSSG
jgi:uncharacterized protein (DUF924 family)